eukprot:662060-Pleurochrysis_carterae.AAC.1
MAMHSATVAFKLQIPILVRLRRHYQTFSICGIMASPSFRACHCFRLCKPSPHSALAPGLESSILTTRPASEENASAC